MAAKKASQAMAEALRAEGVRYVFGLPGGHSVTILYDELYRDPQITPILARHETAGAFAALGYAQISGEAGVCQGTAGPGFAQMILGLQEAWYSRLPLVAIAPNAPAAKHGQGALQEFGSCEAVQTFVKWSYRVDRPEKMPWVMRQAFHHALAPPCGPVLVDVPIDVGGAAAEMEDYVPTRRVASQADPAAVQLAADLLCSAERPLLVCGRGVHQARAWEEVRELAELLHLPVMVTNHGKSSLPDSHPLCVGGTGCNLTVVGAPFVREADCELWVGSQIEEFAVGRGWDVFAGKRLINLNADAAQFGRNVVPAVSLLGDAKLTLRQLIEAARDRAPQWGFGQSLTVSRIAELRREYAAHLAGVQQASKGPVHPTTFLDALQQVMPRETIVVLGEGANRLWTASHLRVETPGHWVSASDFGCMGYAVAAAIGAALARPGTPVVCLTGDGSFQMQMQEIVVAAQYRLPITYVVFNNNCLGWVKWGQQQRWQERYCAVDYEVNWRHAEAARAAGCAGFLVDHPDGCRKAIEQAFAANAAGQPAVVEVLTPWEEVPVGLAWYRGSESAAAGPSAAREADAAAGD